MKCWDSSFFENIKYSKVDINHDGFEIVDEDAEFKPYDIKHQLLLDNYFGGIDKGFIRKPRRECRRYRRASEIRENIPRMTKKETIKK